MFCWRTVFLPESTLCFAERTVCCREYAMFVGSTVMLSRSTLFPPGAHRPQISALRLSSTVVSKSVGFPKRRANSPAGTAFLSESPVRLLDVRYSEAMMRAFCRRVRSLWGVGQPLRCHLWDLDGYVLVLHSRVPTPSPRLRRIVP